MNDGHDPHPPETRASEALVALGDHLILEDFEPREDRTPSGLLIPKSAVQPENGYRRFRVIAVGPLCSDDRTAEIPEPEIHPGDIVLAPSGELGTYRESGHTYYVAQYNLIAAIIQRQ
jgi:co-chaperonin GroES (HSP10)